MRPGVTRPLHIQPRDTGHLQGTGVHEGLGQVDGIKSVASGDNVVCVKLSWPVDFGLSLYPSFLLVVFEEYDGVFVKTGGHCTGLTLTNPEPGTLCVSSPSLCGDLNDIVRYLSGEWLNPLQLHLPDKLGYVVRVYANRGLSVVALPHDIEVIAVAAFLSRNTDFHVNVVRWVKSIIAASREGGITREAVERMAKKFKSYQLVQLAEIFDELQEAIAKGAFMSARELRCRLMEVKYVGPKVANAVLLFSGLSSEYAPPDTHLVRQARLLGLLSKSPGKLVVPTKTMCLNADCDCDACYYSDQCIVGVLRRESGRLAGYIQTALYVNSKLFCTRGDCSRCPLRMTCSK